jgi:hypothetical protein
MPNVNNSQKQKNVQPNRRAFINSIAKLLVGGGATGRIVQNTLKAPEGNTVEMETQNGVYKIIYSNHTIPNDPHTIDDVDVIICERPGLKYPVDQDPQTAGLNYTLDGQHGVTFRAAALQKKSIFYVDVSPALAERIQTSETVSNLLPGAEAIAGIGLLASSRRWKQRMSDETPVETGNATKEESEKIHDRRSWLSTVLRKAKQVGGLYLLTPIDQMASTLWSTGFREPNERSIARQTERALHDVNRVAHPELNDEGRNILIAQKAETIARLLIPRFQRKPRISIFVGALHHNIERQLVSSEEMRIRALRSIIGSEQMSEEQWILETIPTLKNEGNTVECRGVRLLRDPAFFKQDK